MTSIGGWPIIQYPAAGSGANAASVPALDQFFAGSVRSVSEIELRVSQESPTLNPPLSPPSESEHILGDGAFFLLPRASKDKSMQPTQKPEPQDLTLKGMLVRTVRERFTMEITPDEAAEIHTAEDAARVLDADRAVYDFAEEDSKVENATWEIVKA